MNSLRIENKDIYKIEVNDKGECIEFNLNDISNSIKFVEALKDIEKLEKKYTDKMKNIEVYEEDDFQSKEVQEYVKIEQEMFKEMRLAMDKVLGENACQKIFGDRNYYEMFDDLIEELSKPREELKGKSHLDMINLKSDEIHKRIMNKYQKNKKATI